MSITIQIDNISKPEVKAFLDYARSLKFVKINEDEVMLTDSQKEAIEEARLSLVKNGGKAHQEVMSEMKKKYPQAFSK